MHWCSNDFGIGCESGRFSLAILSREIAVRSLEFGAAAAAAGFHFVVILA